jgi:hypothetical protein
VLTSVSSSHAFFEHTAYANGSFFKEAFTLSLYIWLLRRPRSLRPDQSEDLVAYKECIPASQCAGALALCAAPNIGG